MRYDEILEGKAHSKYLENKNLIGKLIEKACEIYSKCRFCEHRCEADRNKTTGVCNVKEARIASEFLHYGEESMLVPSYTIFFSGCPFKCVFCQNWDISQDPDSGIYIKPEVLAEKIKKRKTESAKNVNWVGGDPIPNIKYILEVLNLCETNIPQIFNSNMYCSTETMEILKHIIDVYLTDFKYGNNGCALRYSKVRNYCEVVERNHLLAYESGEVIVRHLILPGHIECCTKPVIDWIAENIRGALVNLMDQYRPEYKASCYPEISRGITEKEFLEALSYAERACLNLV